MKEKEWKSTFQGLYTFFSFRQFSSTQICPSSSSAQPESNQPPNQPGTNTIMHLTTFLLTAILAITATVSPSTHQSAPSSISHPLTQLFLILPQAHCGTDNDCCYNSVDSCINQHFKYRSCKKATLCENQKTLTGAVPSCNGADCCVISTGLGGSCH